ncbi:MAG: FlgD immunoglobulin-like domain containing protein [Bacteroidota bacterium]
MKNILLLFVFSTFVVSISNAQERTLEELRTFHHEVEEDPYISVNRDLMPKSPAYHVRTSSYFTTQVNVDANGDNIVGDAANEPSLAVDPTNTDRIVLGWRQFDNISSNFRQAGFGYSNNGGQVFVFPGPIDPGVFRSDPVLDFDVDGNLYYNSLASGFTCDVYKIEDGSFNWQGPFPANGGDKQWMRMDRTNGVGARNNYSNWNSSFTTCSNQGYFTRSTDGSETFESCIEIDEDPRWGTLAVDANGDLYITGTSNNGTGIVLIKSSNAKDAGSTIVWDFSTFVDLDGDLAVGQPINPQGLTGQTWVDVDLNNDNVYVLASVDRSSNGDPADVMFAKSTDGGQSFAAPIRINTDSGTSAYQWFGTMSVAPNGRIDVIWLDTRDAPSGTRDSVLYYSFSEDEGETWSVNEPLSDPFNPNIGYPMQNKMGDYFDMKSDNDYAHVAWANTLNGGQDVYYTRITPIALGLEDFATHAFGAKVSPNPVRENTSIQFTIQEDATTQVVIYDLQGKKVNTLLDETVSGNQQLNWDGTNEAGVRLNDGLYFVSITSGREKATMKVVLQ